MPKLNIKKSGAIFFNIGALVLLIVSIFGNDRFLNLVFIFATAGIILSSIDKSSSDDSESETNRSSNKWLLRISILLIIVGIIFAIIV